MARGHTYGASAGPLIVEVATFKRTPGGVKLVGLQALNGMPAGIVRSGSQPVCAGYHPCVVWLTTHVHG